MEQLRAGTYGKPFVIDDGGSRSLHFTPALVQSAMRLEDPFSLEFAYTRKMMGFLLFHPQPRSILMLGLGGGSLAKFCHRHLPEARITVLEIDPNVLAFRDQFLVPADDDRFRVVLGDAADHVARAAELQDVVLIDAFDKDGFAASIGSDAFYADVRAALAARGVMVANLVGGKAERLAHLGRMRAAFDDNVIVLPVEQDGNLIAFAFREASFEPRWRLLSEQARELRTRFGLDFPRFAAKLERSRKLGYLRRMLQQADPREPQGRGGPRRGVPRRRGRGAEPE